MAYLLILLTLVFCSSQVFAYDDGGAFYRDETPNPANIHSSCGSFCITNPNYYETYLFQTERNTRMYAPIINKTVEEEEMNALNYRKIRGTYLFRGLSWGPETTLSRRLVDKEVRWSRLARDVGFNVSENGKSFRSALWREIRKPILYDIRDRITAPYKSKKLSLREKTQVWLLEQTVDAGASSLNLDSYGGGSGQYSNMDFGIRDTILKFKPRLDPIKGRYGVRFKMRKYYHKKRPVYLGFNLNYCNSSTGLGSRKCMYQQEVSSSLSFKNTSQRWTYYFYVSYQTDSLDKDVYQVDGEFYEHKPWIGGATITYAFY